jgi:hypothetical protein
MLINSLTTLWKRSKRPQHRIVKCKMGIQRAKPFRYQGELNEIPN